MMDKQGAVKAAGCSPLHLSPFMVFKTLLLQKTATRRPMLPQPEYSANAQSLCWNPKLKSPLITAATSDVTPMIKACPLGAVGDCLWVREAWGVSREFDKLSPKQISSLTPVYYSADYVGVPAPLHIGRIRQGMFMPRWASRITLQITQIDLERLQEITPTKALKEGFRCPSPCKKSDCEGCSLSSLSLFREEWNRLYTDQALQWEANPWVWVYSYKILNDQRVA